MYPYPYTALSPARDRSKYLAKKEMPLTGFPVSGILRRDFM